MGAGSKSTSRAPSATGEAPPPLAYKDVEPLLAAADLSADPSAEQVVLVGGQALNFWADYYAERSSELRAAVPLTSKDIDFVGPPAAVTLCAARLGGRVQFADVDHATANYAVVHFVDLAGHPRVVDFLDRICGVQPDDLRRTALMVDPFDADLKATGLRISIMSPVVCMESRLSNTVEYAKYQGEHGLLQARMSIHCARAFLMELADSGDLRAVAKVNERIFRFACGKTGKAAMARFHLDPFDAVLVDDRLSEGYRTIRYPQMKRELAKSRGRGTPGLGR